MRKTTLAAAAAVAAASLAAPLAACAQSSVSIAGLMDAGVSWVSNQGGHGNARFDDGIGFPNLLVFTGREDLGDGNAAVFRLENQYMLGSGSFIPQESLFTRQTMVGLDSAAYGRLSFGKLYDFMVDSLFFGNDDGAAMYVAGLYDFRGGPFTKLALPNNPTGNMDWDRLSGDASIANSVKYSSPVYAGFSGGAMYSFGGVAGSIGANNASSFGLNYANGGFGMGAAYTNAKSTVPGGQTSVRNWGVGAHYDAGAWTTTALFTTVHNSINGGSVWSAQLAGIWHITPFTSLSGAWLYMKGNDTVGDNHANQLSAALSYALSKRTVVYLSEVYQRTNEGAQALINGLAGPDAASSGPNQSITRIGLMTRF